MSILRRLTGSSKPREPERAADPPSPSSGNSPPGSPRRDGGGSSPRGAVKTKVVCLGDPGVGKTSALLTCVIAACSRKPSGLYFASGDVKSYSYASFQLYVRKISARLATHYRASLLRLPEGSFRPKAKIELSWTQVEGKTVAYEMMDGLLKDDDPKLGEKISHHGESIFLLCFAVNSVPSFRNMKTKWVVPLKEAHPVARSFVVGLKADLRDDVALAAQMERQGLNYISVDQAAAYAREIGAVGYIEMSAVTQKGLSIAFDAVLRVALLPTLRAQPLKPLPPVKPEQPAPPHLLPNLVGADIARMWERSAYADMRFVQDNWNMVAHTVIVSSGCRAFKNGLFAKLCTFSKDKYNILNVTFPPGLQPGFCQAMLKYIYTGQWLDSYRQQLDALTHTLNCRLDDILYLPEQKVLGRTELPRRGQKYTDSYTQSLTDGLVEMLTNESVPDVEFVLSDGTVKAHKVICAVRNYRLKVLLQDMTDIGVMHSVPMMGYNRADFANFLRHLYNGLNPVTTIAAAATLLKVACDFKAEALILMLEEQLIREMNVQQSVSALRVAHECGAEHLRKHAVWWLSTNYMEQSKTQAFSLLRDELRAEVTKVQWPPMSYYVMLDRWREDDANWQREREVFVNSNAVAQEKCVVQ